MTCGGCSGAVERVLGKLGGLTQKINKKNSVKNLKKNYFQIKSKSLKLTWMVNLFM